MRHCVFVTAVGLCAAFCPRGVAEEVGEEQVRAALRRAVEFFDSRVSIEGGYLWRYSNDLKLREGEGAATRTTAWVQPPGTPAVGHALLSAYRRTGEDYLLDAARRTAQALVQGQLESGGWDYRIEFDPQARGRYRYRVDRSRTDGRNTSTLDDNTTQAALSFLMQVDRVLAFGDRSIHEAAEHALQRLVAVQYPNGAWPQRFDQPPDPGQHPVRRASYPSDWSRTHPAEDYRSFYTFNDNTIADTISTFFLAEEIYGDSQYGAAARRGGDFILLAQMPDPQPAWAQQYNAQMHPAWARRFEPPAVTGGESQQVLRTLMMLYRHTGDKKYLEPVPRALAYLSKSRLPDGQLARFYELRTNRPLYFTKEYVLTYDDDDLPTHYGFKVRSALDSIQREYDRLSAGVGLKDDDEQRSLPPRMTPQLAARAAEIVSRLDERGAWVESGSLRHQDASAPAMQVIETRTFIENVDVLSRYLAVSRE